jgi:hypothetical protein
MKFNYHNFNSQFFLDFKLNLNCPAQKIFGIFSSVVFGFFIKNYYFPNYYFPINKTTKEIEQVVEKIIPYEEKYNKQFDDLKSYDECDIPSEILNQKIASLKDKYNHDLHKLKEEYSEMMSYYYNSNNESDDDDDIYDDEYYTLLKHKIIKLQSLLKNENQIKTNALQDCLTDIKSSLMNSLQNNFILENTPIGNVVMVYNCKKEGFSYYSDKSISNKYLESVCKKYCIQFKCKMLFNDVFINEGKLSNFKFLKNEVKNKNKKNAKLSFRSFKEQFSLF